MSELRLELASDFNPVLDPSEFEWRDLYPYLLTRGYRLRPRYNPQWPQYPDIAKQVRPRYKKHAKHYPEEFIGMQVPGESLDAVQVSTDTQVVLSLVRHPHMVEIAHYLQSPGVNESDEPDNHVLPILDILDHPTEIGFKIFVHPLYRPVLLPGFETIGEVLDFIYQAFLGLQHLHSHNITLFGTRDISDVSYQNIVMVTHPDMYPNSFHFMRPRHDPNFTHRVYPAGPRTKYPPKYYWAISHNSQFIDPDDPIAPYFFSRDVQALGTLIRKSFVEGTMRMPYLIDPELFPLSIDWSPLSRAVDAPIPIVPSTNFLKTIRKPLTNPHFDPFSDIFSPEYFWSDPSPISRLIRNMVDTSSEQTPTIFKATMALERLLISLMPLKEAAQLGEFRALARSKLTSDSSDQASTITMDPVVINPLHLSYAPAMYSPRGWLCSPFDDDAPKRLFGHDVTFAKWFWRTRCEHLMGKWGR